METKVSSFRRKVKKSIGPTTKAMNEAAVQSSSVVKCEEIDVPLPAKISKRAVEKSQKPKGYHFCLVIVMKIGKAVLVSKWCMLVNCGLYLV